MRFDVPKPWLLACNGLIWGAAGVNILRLGIALKVTGAASAYFMAFFYTGLGIALTESGLRYLSFYKNL